MDAISNNKKADAITSANSEDELALARDLLTKAIAILDAEANAIAAAHVSTALDMIKEA